MKKLLILAFVFVLCLALAACDPEGDPSATTAVTTTTAAPEEVLEEISEPENFDNVTIKMVGTVDDDAFDYDILFADGNCLMIEGGSDYTEFFEGEESTMVRAMFLDVALALLAEGEHFTLTNEGYRCDDAVTFTTEILGMDEPATITCTNSLVTLDNAGKLLCLSCNMLQSCEDNSLNVVVSFTFTDYGTTVVEAPAAE